MRDCGMALASIVVTILGGKMVDVLISDEDPGSLRFIEALLKAGGFEVESFSQLSEAVAPCLRRKYKMALISISHKGGSEEVEAMLEPLRMMHELDPDMPLVVVCDQESLEMERKLREAGIFYLLTKPFSSRELRAVVESAISKHNRGAVP